MHVPEGAADAKACHHDTCITLAAAALRVFLSKWQTGTGALTKMS
jgi:hypothetical protein